MTPTLSTSIFSAYLPCLAWNILTYSMISHVHTIFNWTRKLLLRNNGEIYSIFIITVPKNPKYTMVMVEQKYQMIRKGYKYIVICIGRFHWLILKYTEWIIRARSFNSCWQSRHKEGFIIHYGTFHWRNSQWFPHGNAPLKHLPNAKNYHRHLERSAFNDVNDCALNLLLWISMLLYCLIKYKYLILMYNDIHCI